MPALLRPLTLGELLDRVFQLYRSRFALFAGISAIAYLPAFFMQTIIVWIPKVTSASGAITAAGGYIVLLIVRYLALSAAIAATITVVSAAYLEQPITVRQAYARVSGMMVRISLIMFGMGLGIGLGFVLLIVPGVILALMWALAIPVAVLEDTGFGESLSRSRYLTAGHRGRVFAIFLLYFALLLALEFAIGAPIGAIAAIKGASANPSAFPTIFLVLTFVVGFVVATLVTPVLTISLSLMYYDERVLKEAFDIQLMMNAVSGNPPQAGSSAAATA